MKVTEHVEHLLGQGRKPKELIELGFPKSVVTRVRRRLRKETTASQLKTQKGKAQAKTSPQLAVISPTETTPVQRKQGSLESKVQELQSRVETLETLRAGLEDIENRLKGTPTLGVSEPSI